jgi:hypothetical protein
VEHSFFYQVPPPGAYLIRVISPSPENWESGAGRFLLRLAWMAEGENPAGDALLRPIQANDGSQWWVLETADEARLCLPDLGLHLHLFLPQREVEVKLAAVPELGQAQWRNVLRVLYFYGFLEGQGLLLHASGLMRQGQAYLFPGVAEAGKTTIVRHSPGMPVLSDEVVAVQLAGNGNPATAYGTPFYGDWGQPGERLAAPVRGLYFPVKASGTQLLPLTPRETLTRLLPCIFTYTTFRSRLEQLFHLASELVFQVPGFALHFRPEPEMWEAIGAS